MPRNALRRHPMLALVPLLAVACTSGASNSPATVGSATANAGDAQTTLRIDSARMLRDLRTLAADSFAGRQVGTPGGALARAHVASRMATTGARALTDSLVIPFAFRRGRDSAAAPIDAGNIVAVVRGTRYPARYIVLSAHFDHVGIGRPMNGDSIYNGADDNASGTAAVLELARWFAAHPPQRSIIFAAFDAEESGLRGARAFVATPPVPRDSIIVNVNLDMVSRNERDELFAVGTFDNPVLRPYVERARERARITLRVGHEGPSATGSDNWTAASDHGAFRAERIPYLYFGVEDHSGYHQPSDAADAITPGFYALAVETVLDVILDIDRDPGPIIAARR